MLAFSTRPQCPEAERLSQGSPRATQGETAFGLLPVGAQPFQSSPGHGPGTGPAVTEEAWLLWAWQISFDFPKNSARVLPGMLYFPSSSDSFCSSVKASWNKNSSLWGHFP